MQAIRGTITVTFFVCFRGMPNLEDKILKMQDYKKEKKQLKFILNQLLINLSHLIIIIKIPTNHSILMKGHAHLEKRNV